MVERRAELDVVKFESDRMRLEEEPEDPEELEERTEERRSRRVGSAGRFRSSLV